MAEYNVSSCGQTGGVTSGTVTYGCPSDYNPLMSIYPLGNVFLSDLYYDNPRKPLMPWDLIYPRMGA